MSTIQEGLEARIASLEDRLAHLEAEKVHEQIETPPAPALNQKEKIKLMAQSSRVRTLGMLVGIASMSMVVGEVSNNGLWYITSRIPDLYIPYRPVDLIPISIPVGNLTQRMLSNVAGLSVWVGGWGIAGRFGDWTAENWIKGRLAVDSGVSRLLGNGTSGNVM